MKTNVHVAKSFVLFLLWIVSATVATQAQPAKQSILYNSVPRYYYAYAPASYNSATDTLPLLVFLHGFDGGIDSYDGKIHFQQAADRFNWLILLPEALEATVPIMGMNVPAGKVWNSGIVMSMMGNSFTPNSDVDDAGFLVALADSAATQYRIYDDSLFFAGFSMGAFMTYRMAIEKGDRIDGIAAASGLIPLCFADSVPARHIDVLHIHGTEDNMIARDGIASAIPGMGQMTLGLSMDSTVAYWRDFNQCNQPAQSNTYANAVDDGLTFVLHTYNGGIDGSRVALLSVEGGKHKWYEEEHDVSYLTVIHDFFTGSRSYNFAGIRTPSRSTPLLLCPNPADAAITVQSTLNTTLFIYSANGQQMGTYSLMVGLNRVNVSTYPSSVYMLRTAARQGPMLIIK